LNWCVVVKQQLRIDLGCGGNSVFPGTEIFSEPSDVHVDIRIPIVIPSNFVRASVTGLPFRGSSFHEAICFDVLEHLDSPTLAYQALSEIHRISESSSCRIPKFLFCYNPDHKLVYLRKRFFVMGKTRVIHRAVRLLFLSRYFRWFYRHYLEKLIPTTELLIENDYTY
jgi:hypothetical protein